MKSTILSFVDFQGKRWELLEPWETREEGDRGSVFGNEDDVPYLVNLRLPTVGGAAGQPVGTHLNIYRQRDTRTPDQEYDNRPRRIKL